MKLSEIRKIISDDSFEKLKNIELYKEVNRTHSLFYSIQNNNPGMLASDIFASSYEDILSDVGDLFDRVKKVYLQSDNTYQRINEVWIYINK